MATRQGRPPKPSELVRSHMARILYTEAEWRLIKQAAALLGLSGASEYVRQRTLAHARRIVSRADSI